ncbi:MAG: hypothetical protein IKT32_06260 [Clostridia bacterium]|nr:hypothetical protein [Clostridia bacterium]
MKKKLKRIICIVLVLIVCFSVSACFGDCVKNCMDFVLSGSTKRGREEAEKQQKALDSIQKEVGGYKLKVDWSSDLYETDDSWIKLRMYNVLNFDYTYEYAGKVGTMHVDLEGGYGRFSLTETEDGKAVEKTILIGAEKINAEYKVIERECGEISETVHIERGGVYCLDGVWFLITKYEDEYTIGKRKNYYLSTHDFPPLFYLIDFENQKLLYAGYAEGWYERAEFKDYRGVFWAYNTVKVEKT